MQAQHHKPPLKPLLSLLCLFCAVGFERRRGTGVEDSQTSAKSTHQPAGFPSVIESMPFRWLAFLPSPTYNDNNTSCSNMYGKEGKLQEVCDSISVETSVSKVQALEAHNTACCGHIYRTALQHLQQNLQLVALDLQFGAILDQEDYIDEFNSTCSIGCRATNSCKNRYRDVVPFDSNRVHLPSIGSSISTMGISSNSECPSVGLNSGVVGSWDMKCSRSGYLSDSRSQIRSAVSSISADSRAAVLDDSYINASFLSDPGAGVTVCSPVGYIATQGPLPNTVTDFWRMVTTVNVSAIVMLTELHMDTIGHGSNRALCAAYFPDNEGDILQLPGGFTVECVYRKQLTASLLFRQLEVVCPAVIQSATRLQQPQQEKRIWVNHYKLAGWPDAGVPQDTQSVRALSQALDSCRRAGCKIVAHCSAGVGRTGTFIAVDILLQRLQSLTLREHGSVNNTDIHTAMDIADLVTGLRKQRRGTVQTSGQYEFIWRAVTDELECLLHSHHRV